ncbi:hypothetical protein DE146DRAFT_751217 [Phaeosphaeria sp. MPI-PUGE-AT-0046c]|nr:hypothetical protein DE146DRAFT_751217 [Phaeosphaeria sp. MPI-PUGE-AT-0046c]
MDEEARTVYWIQARDASGASPSLVLDSSKRYLFSSRPKNGTLTRYSFGPNYALLDEGTMDIPAACHTTSFSSLHLTNADYNTGIWGTASTGTCSVLFGVTTDGYTQLRSNEIAGDVHSLAWGSSGRSLHALDSHSSTTAMTSIVNFRISDNPDLEDIIATSILANVSDASQIVSHPTSDRLYVVTKGTNELISIEAQENANSSARTAALSRYKLIPTSLDASQFHTSSLATSSSKDTLWTLSQSKTQAIITAFSLNTTTGEIITAAARASWSGLGDGQITAAPFAGGNVIAITNSPAGYVTLLGLDSGVAAAAQDDDTAKGHEYLEYMDLGRSGAAGSRQLAPKIKSYGRTMLDEFIDVGESVWVD